jgi:hypothetical protein
LKKKGCKAKDSFFKPFDETIKFNGFKMFSFRYKSHVHEIILRKNMFGFTLKLIWDFQKNSMFLALNQNIHT